MLLTALSFSLGVLIFQVTDSPLTALASASALLFGLLYVEDQVEKIIQAIKTRIDGK